MRRVSGVLGLAALAALSSFLPTPGRAQESGTLAAACASAGGPSGRCRDAEVAARGLTGQLGLMAGWGSEVPGSASTLGTKIGNSPRFSTSFRAGGMSVGLPHLFDESVGPAPEVSFLVPALNVGLAAGVFDGFSPLPTVGGMFSLDLFGSAALVMPPSSQGFKGSATSGTVGARLGLLRESFTLPGVTVSASRRFGGSMDLGDVGLGDPARVSVDPSVTSVRVTVGKDLVGVGVLVGWGWDDASGDATLEVSGFGPGPARVDGPVEARRALYFGGLSMNFLLLQLSAEGGWVEGFPVLPGSGGSSFDPSRGSAFGSLALRFTP